MMPSCHLPYCCCPEQYNCVKNVQLTPFFPKEKSRSECRQFFFTEGIIFILENLYSILVFDIYRLCMELSNATFRIFKIGES